MTHHPSHRRPGAAPIPATVVFLSAVVLALAAPWSASPAAGQTYEWSLESIPSRANLKAVWGSSPSAVFAVGDSGTALRFDGTSWTKLPWTLGDVSLLDVWGTSASDVYAVGGYTLYHYDGTAWSLFPAQPFVPGFGAYALWGTSPNHIIVVGQGLAGDIGPVRVWDGTGWTTAIATPAKMTDVWGTGPGNVFAVSENGAIVHTIECQPGRLTWEVVAFRGNYAKGLWGSGPGDVYVGGIYGLSHRESEPDARCQELWLHSGLFDAWFKGVWGRAANDVYAVGSHPGLGIGAYIEHFDGTNWRISPAPEGPGGATGSAQLQAVWGDPSGDFWAVGDRGTVLRNIPSTPDTGLVVNSTATMCDAAIGDGKCDTGRMTPDGQVECTLCAAIQEANAEPDHDPIKFDIHTSDPGFRPATQTFVISAGPFEVNSPATIDATTQPGYVGQPKIELDGTGRSYGIMLQGGGTTVRGLAIHGYQGAAIEIAAAGGNTVAGCFLGTNAAGAAADSNRFGVLVQDSPNNTIGGAGVNEGNVISGNTLNGVKVTGGASVGNRIIGNRIGLDAGGARAIPNRFHGILVDRGASATVIGGGSAGERNLISGNSHHGIAILDARDTRILGNHIGVDVTGLLLDLGNQKGGIVVEGASVKTTIGGTGPNDGNVISANVGHAITFLGPGVTEGAVHRNLIGLDVTGASELPNTSDGIRIEEAIGIRIGDGGELSGNFIIASYQGIGIVLKGATTRDVVIENNHIGYLASPDHVRAANAAGAIWIEGGVEDVTIGGLDVDQWNRVYGTIAAVGVTTRRVRFLGNHLAMPPSLLDEPDSRLPFDLGADGPSCNCWGGTAGRTNDGVAVPRITKLSTSLVEGMSTPGATVFVYRVLGAGRDRTRYFAHSVEAQAYATAADDGSFVIPVALAAGDQVIAAATDTDGNTSEMTQLKRPVIFLHGIGGAWLVANDGTEIWLPDGLTYQAQNGNLSRMGFNPDGTSKEPITAREMLESVIGMRVVYGPIMDWLQSHGHAGDARNLGGPDMDAWRFWYDWRRSPADAARDLKALVERVTGTGTDVARSCEVDIVAHSYGGVVSNVYIRGEPEHSRCRVHRYITMGIPVLGTPLAAGSHTRGYIFGLEQEWIYGWPTFAGGFYVHWSRMITMGRNLPAAYALMPSQKFWWANRGNYASSYLEDLNGEPLISHQQTIDFMGAPKLDGQGRPLGLDRNVAIWNRELDRVHELSDDWSDFQGPPQVFRLVGKIPNSAIKRWSVFGDPPSRVRYRFVSDFSRWEPGDTYEHWSYRERLTPVLATGDGTVLLSSATLGHEPAGMTDYSGVGRSRWIEDFQYFPCLHNDLLLEKCAEGDLQSLEYVTDVLHSGYRVPPPASPAVASPAAAKASGLASGLNEIVYVTGSSPLTARVEDEVGDFIGPPDPAEPERIEHRLSEVGYWSSSQTACLSFAQAKRYTVTISALADPADVQVIRIVSDGATNNQNVLFPRTALAAGGVLRMVFPAGGAPASAPLALDVAGDGTFESAVDPAASATSTSTAPAIPLPQPFRLNLVGYRDDAGPRSRAVRFPDVGGPAWGWSASAPSAWLSASALSGTTPDSLVLSFDASSLATGTYSDSLSLTLDLGAFTTTVPVQVSLSVLDAPSVASIALTPAYVTLHPGEQRTFAAQGFDETGGPLPVTPTWSADGGTIDADGRFTAGAFNGLYFVRARSGSVEAEAAVEIVGGAELTTTPAAFGLHQNFPNPFSGGTVIAFDAQVPSHVRLTLYDVRGRLLSTLVDADYPAGRHTHVLGDAGLSNGVYFYRVEMGSFAQTRKLAYVR